MRIVSDGTLFGTRLIDENGRDLTEKLPLSGVCVRINATSGSRVELYLAEGVKFDVNVAKENCQLFVEGIEANVDALRLLLPCEYLHHDPEDQHLDDECPLKQRLARKATL